MAQITLTAQAREPGTHAKQIRLGGLVPGVIYGGTMATESVQVDRISLEKAVQQGALTHLLTLELGDGRQAAVVIKDLQRHPVKRYPLHIDFHQVSLTENIEIDVPVRTFGVLATEWGVDYVLIHNVESVTVSCLPTNIPEALTIDITSLSPDHHILHAHDLIVPANVELKIGEDEAIVSLSRTRAAMAEEEEEAEGVTLTPSGTEPEVVAKGKAARGEEGSERGSDED